MKWISDVWVDLLITIFIVVSVFTDYNWMEWVVIGYTGIMLLAKAVVLIGDDKLQLIRKTKTAAPDWFNHLLYAVNTGVLLYGAWWITAGAWLLIWILSGIAQRKMKKASGT